MAVSLTRLAALADKLCEVTKQKKPVWCPLWPDCGCRFPELNRSREEEEEEQLLQLQEAEAALLEEPDSEGS